ncbi:hypothetical protein A9Q89_05225 [Gammaproteobacteria bacterium 53_120_T64]|nr:hypothetical protein A9Q89_05225 [Gammaproteobacteria bacterium 53_120_T64]
MPVKQPADHALSPLLIDAMQTFAAILEVDGTLIFTNSAALKSVEITLEAVRGEKFWDYPWFHDDKAAKEQIQNMILQAATGENIRDEIQISTVQGSMSANFCLHSVIEAEHITHVIVEGYEITDNSRLDAKALRHQQCLQSLLNDMQSMIALLDIEGRVTLVNNTPLSIAGIKSEDVLGKALWDTAWFTGDPDAQQQVKSDISRALSGTTTVGEIQIHTPQGWLWIEFSVHPARDKSGNIVQLIAEGHDLRARRQVEKEREQALRDLQEREQNLAVTLDSIGDAVITTDAQGDITHMNPIAEQLTGWPFSEAQNQPLGAVFSIFNTSTGQCLPSPVEKLMRTREVVHLSNHTTLRTRNGDEYQIADSAAPIRDSEGHILGAILVFSDVSEQYRLREKARATQERLQRIFDGMQTMVGILDTQGRLNFINNTPLLVTGFSRAAVLGIKLWEAPWFAYKPSSAASVEQVVRSAAQGENTLTDVLVNTLDGEIWVAFSAHPVFDDNHVVAEVVVEAREINARKNTEMALRTSEQRLRRYRDQAPLATIEWSTEHRIVGWNDAAEKLFGYSFSDVMGQPFSILIPLSIDLDLKKIWGDLIAQNGGETVTSKILTKCGKTIYTRWHNAPFFDDEGRAIGAASVVLDLTNERAAQQALHDSEKLQRETLNSMVEGVVVTDVEGLISSVNSAAERITGYRTEELLGQHVTQLLSGQQREHFQHNMQAYLDTGDLRFIGMGMELNITCKDGDSFPTILAVAELSQESSGRQRFISSFRDLSEAKQQQEQLRRSQKMDALGKLTGGIAHDFNNMLGIITGYAELLENALAKEKKLANYAHEIHRAGDRGAKLTRKLLAFSQQAVVSASSVNINALINKQQHMLATSLTPRINMVYELGPDTWPIYLDADDLDNAIINICINAMHAIEGNGQVTVRTENIRLRSVNAQLKNLASGDYVQLSIIDNGKGMDEATREQIFDPFYTTKGEQGTGLGLSQVYGFVERSHGAIEVSSVPGHGTQFRLYFPREILHAARQKHSTQTPEKKTDGNETILVVDDEKHLLELSLEILGQQGYKVLAACNCSEALQLLEGNTVDLMFSDVVMPDMDGYELAGIVAEKYPAIKIQMTSGFSDDRENAATDASLHQNLLPKPYRAQALLTKIRELLDS